MRISDYTSYSNIMSNSGILFGYTGYLSEDLVSSVGNALKAKLYSHKASNSLNNKIFGIFIEQLQNVLRYGDIEGGEDLENPFVGQGRHPYKDGLFCVGQTGEDYYVISGNYISAQKADSLRPQLEEVTNMSPDEIKQAYRDKLRGEATQYGSGLGLLDIARRAIKPLEYSFHDLDDSDLKFYLLCAHIGANKKSKE